MRVLITGGSRGIGKAIVDLFTKEGHEVCSPSRQEIDLSSPKIILTQTNFDICINNAGINVLANLSEVTEETSMRVNYFSPLQIVQQILPHMENQAYGRILNVGSIWIDQTKVKRHAYSASKAALHSLTKSVTCEYSNKNILCNTLSPGFIETDLTYKNNTEQELQKIVHSVPLKRLGRPEEVAELAYFLTAKNNFITGQNIIMDGGFSCTRN